MSEKLSPYQLKRVSEKTGLTVDELRWVCLLNDTLTEDELFDLADMEDQGEALRRTLEILVQRGPMRGREWLS